MKLSLDAIGYGGKLRTIQMVDERHVASLAFPKGLLLKVGVYTGHKESPA